MRPLAVLFSLLALAACLSACGSGGPSGPVVANGENAKVRERPRPGAKAPAPGVPVFKHGDNSIQTYGVESTSAQRARAAALVRAYLDARAAREWGRVCSLLAARPRAEQDRVARGTGCARAMAAFAARASGRVLREEAKIEPLSYRLGRRFSFLIYRRPDGVWASALGREGGGWKVVSVSPEPIG